MECDAVLFRTNVSEKLLYPSSGLNNLLPFMFRTEMHPQNMKAAGCPETLSTIYQTSRRYITELV